MADYVLSVWKAGDEPGDGGAPIRLSRIGRAGMVAEHATGFDTSEFRRGGAVVDPEASLTAAGLMNEEVKAAVGDELWNRLTPGAVGTALRPLLGTERIYLDLRSDDLQRYPWELLRCANQYIFTSGRTRWALGRPEPTDHFGAGTPPVAEHPLRVLVVIGNHPEDDRIHAQEELMIIERQAHLRNAEVLFTALHHPHATVIEATLKDFRPHVFHFIGHGDGSREEPAQIFVWSAAARVSDPWSAERIRGVFAQAPPRLVVLNACQTAHAPTEATSLVQAFLDAGSLATVAMMGEIRGAASAAFSERFYREIFSGEEVDTAAARARMAVGMLAGDDADMLEVRSNWALPRVSVRGDAQAVVTMPYAKSPVADRWLLPDFVTRWRERWRAWTAMSGAQRLGDGTEARLAVLWGSANAGKRELVNTLAEARSRTGDEVISVDLFGPSTGDWHDLLEKIADAAVKAGFDATALHATARLDGPSGTVFAQFRAGLETMPHAELTDVPVLVVLDGLGDWTEDLVSDTVLPELCRPLLRAPAGSRLRMMVTLEKEPNTAIWGRRPAGWQPVEVGDFEPEEWNRALAHFRDYWYTKIPEPQRHLFEALAQGVAGYPRAGALQTMRAAAKGTL